MVSTPRASGPPLRPCETWQTLPWWLLTVSRAASARRSPSAQPLRVTEIPPHVEGVPTYAVEGTPSDSAIVALQTLIEEPVDLVVSGINKGANMGNDVFISGTMGAALQAHFRGIPAIAISVAALRDVQFDAAAQVARLLAQNVADGRLTAPLLLNVNLPNVPPSESGACRSPGLGGAPTWTWSTRATTAGESTTGSRGTGPDGCWSAASTCGRCAAAASRSRPWTRT